MVRCAMIRSKRSMKLWGACLLFATLVYNVCLSGSGAPQFAEMSPDEAWSGIKPNVSRLRVWGCTAWTFQEKASKLEPKSKPYIFIGMDTRANCFLLFNPFTQRTCSSVNVVFDETDFTDYTVTEPAKPLSQDYCSYSKDIQLLIAKQAKHTQAKQASEASTATQQQATTTVRGVLQLRLTKLHRSTELTTALATTAPLTLTLDLTLTLTLTRTTLTNTKLRLRHRSTEPCN